ncbi:DUF2637 domain-containing protein [Streptomyces sp. NPDC004539]|uniref:DUF2637 domain-containing protein n=1 Tax=Streptomyces sp. NPDC004539 TaxID=3154280 RepID=UPI0033BAD8FF
MSGDQRSRPGMSWWDKATIGAMGGVGGVLSYDALQQMAVAMHVRPELTYLFPVAIDGFIAYGTRALVVLKEAPLRARVYTWSVFGSATATSVWANWTHAVRLNDLTPPGESLHLPDWSVGVLSTIAPLVLGGATHLYIVMSRHTSGSDTDPADTPETQGPSTTSRWSRGDASGLEDPAKPAVRTRWWNRKRTEAAVRESAASVTADEQSELTAVPSPSPVSLTKAPEERAALPPGPASASGAQPQTVPVPESVSASANGTVPAPAISAAAAVPDPVPDPENGTAAPGTAPVGPELKPGTVPGTPASPGPASSPSVSVPAESVPLVVNAAPPAVPAAAAPPAEHGPRHGGGSVPNSSAASRPGGEAAATVTAPHRTTAPAVISPSLVPAVPAAADTTVARLQGPGTVPAQSTVLRAVPTPGTASTGTGPEPRPLPVPAKESGPRTGTVETPGTPTVPAGDQPRPGPVTVPRASTTPNTVPAAPSPVPGTGRGATGEARKRELSEDELEALLPIGRTVAATAEGRLTREALRAGLRAQNVPINNTALGQLLRELKDIEGKPPPARR